MTTENHKTQFQISVGLIGLVLTATGFVVTPVVAYFTASAATEEKIAQNSSDIAVLQNSITNTDNNLEEIKDDLKDIKRSLNIK